ncbi:MAG: flap endonuclease-1 [Candidatus Thorarchaeota archaeon]
MGTNLRAICPINKIEIDRLEGKWLAVDAHNHLFQFITAIRARNGDPIRDSKGRPISHLLGLLPRTANLIDRGIRLAYVFDGPMPELKARTLEKRKNLKIKAKKKYKLAKEREDIEEMRKYAVRTSRLTPEIIESSKALLKAMGVPVIQAPAEADAQAAYMVKEDDCYAAASQDYDMLLHGTPRVARNISKASRRSRGLELIVLEEMLENLGINRNQLIALAMFIGTDYNPDGVKGIAFKRGLKLLRNNTIGESFEKVAPDLDWRPILDLFNNMAVNETYSLEWKTPDEDALYELLVEKHDFSEKRVEKRVKQLWLNH